MSTSNFRRKREGGESETDGLTECECDLGDDEWGEHVAPQKKDEQKRGGGASLGSAQNESGGRGRAEGRLIYDVIETGGGGKAWHPPMRHTQVVLLKRASIIEWLCSRSDETERGNRPRQH